MDVPRPRPSWCPNQKKCEFVYVTGEICIGCLTPADRLKPWKNAYTMCFGLQRSVCIRTMDLIRVFGCVKHAVRYERRNDP
jgi:hypothetical protein